MKTLTAIIVFAALIVRADIISFLWVASFGINMYLLSEMVLNKEAP